jgi:hypothetical protein
MSVIKAALRVAKVIVLAAAASTANAEVWLPDGNDWAKSTERERLAYILGLSNTLSVGYAADEKRLPGNRDTFTHRAVAGLAGTTVEQAVNVSDAWNKTNPNQLTTPVFKVLWDQIGRPRVGNVK